MASTEAAAEAALEIVVFTLDARRYGLPLHAVQRIVRIVDITPLPKAPAIVLGIVNVQGRIVPVVDLRRRFRLPERRPVLSDHLVIAETPRRPLAFIADEVRGVERCPDHELTAPEGVVPGLEYLAGIARRRDGLVLIHDLSKFLGLDEEEVLERALNDG